MSSFLEVETCKIADLAVDNIAIIGALNATPYEIGKKSHSEDAPAAVRSISQKFASWHSHYDFDTETELLASNASRVRDVGDLMGDPDNPAVNRAKIGAAVRNILNLGATPVILGGDDSVPIPVLQGFEDHGPVW
ncbi:MAG: arginase family protein, partial [Pseudomonadota bacterium]